MTVAIILSVLAGMFVGVRFKVLVIIPVILVAIVVAATVTAAQGGLFLSVLVASVLSALGVQLGYLCGTFVSSVKEVPETAPTETQSAHLPLNISPRSVD